MISNRPPHIQILNKIKIFALILHKATRQQHSPKCNVHSKWSDSLIKSKWSYIFICQLEKTQGLTPHAHYLGGLSSEMLVNHDAFSWAPFPPHPHPNYTTTATYKNGHRRQKRLVLARNILYLSWSHLKDISRFSPPQISKPGSYSPREVKYFLHRNNTMLCLYRDKILFFLFLLPWRANHWQKNMNFIWNVRAIGLSQSSPVHRKETARHGWAENGLAEVLRPANKV